MATETPVELVQYYVGLLIAQYVGKPNAEGTIANITSQAILPQVSMQQITFSAVPTSGYFVLSYNGIDTAHINYNDDLSTISSKITAITGLSDVVVTGSIASQSLIVTFVGVIPPALILMIEADTLQVSSTAITLDIVETDVTLPLAVQAAFNVITGTSTAVGVQLDSIGKYAGVSRTGFGFTTTITLDDADFLTLIRMAIIKNSSGSSLATIQQFINMFFAGQMFVIDHANMTMDYVISQTLGTEGLLQLFITEGLLPKPMAVQLTAIINPPSLKLFSFRTYSLPAPPNSSPFNTYASYSLDSPWLSYQYVI